MDIMKVPPHNLEAEQSIIGAMLVNSDAIPEVMAILEPDDFYREAHKHLARAFFELKDNAGIVSISNYLKEKALFEKTGGVEYLVSIHDQVSTSGQCHYYAQIIKGLSDRRKLITQCQVTVGNAFNLTWDIEETLSSHRDSLKGFIENQGNYRDNEELVKEVFKDIEDRSNNEYSFIGVETGFSNIDGRISGLEPKTTTYLIARPSVGKTALALNIADYVATNYPGKVLFFSLESGDKALTRRRISAHSNVFLSRLRTGDIENGQWPALIEAAQKLSENNLLIIDNPKYKVIDAMVPMAESIGQKDKISLIVIDHIQRMRCRKKTQNRHLEISYVSEEISSLANNLEVPILILCQLSREAVGMGKNRKPELAFMKESGDLEQNADNVWGLYREDNEAVEAEVIGLKGRDIGTWHTHLYFDRFIQKFRDSE